uniref:Uncharacterized protein n=1 Tax=Anguilla anguilla TaxID=7936 RepID=A0A0E9V2K3_ANGAN
MSLNLYFCFNRYIDIVVTDGKAIAKARNSATLVGLFFFPPAFALHFGIHCYCTT